MVSPFTSATTNNHKMTTSSACTGTSCDLDAIIIGSGFGGICQAIELKKNGIHNFLILEKESDLGGTWRDNTYPGAACDVPSALYSFSFEGEQTYDSYLGHKAMLQYIRKVAGKYGILEHIRFGKKVESMSFVEDKDVWEVTVKNTDTDTTDTDEGAATVASMPQQVQQQYRAKIVVTAVGQLHHPNIPHFEGADKFTGEILHTAQFRKRAKELKDFEGKNVAIIGSGASAIQILPELQKVCKEVHLYQRTPSHILPKLTLSRIPEMIVTSIPFLRTMYRGYLEFVSEILLYKAVQGYRLAQLVIKFLCSMNMRLHVKSTKQHSEMRNSLTPSYPPGARRLLMSMDFYPAVVQPNVSVNVSGIKRVEKDGILDCNSSLTKVDVIVYATGFITNPFLFGMNVMGRSKKQLWRYAGADTSTPGVGGAAGIDASSNNRGDRDGEHPRAAHAYLGMATRGFPNLFFMYGPNTNSGHTSVLLFLEEQAKFITRALQFMKDNNCKSIEVKEDVEDAFNREVSERSKGLSFTQIRNSWYLVNGRNVNNWVGSLGEYSERLGSIDILNDFQLHGTNNANADQEASKNESDSGCSVIPGQSNITAVKKDIDTSPPYHYQSPSCREGICRLLLKIPLYSLFMALSIGNAIIMLARSWWRCRSLGHQDVRQHDVHEKNNTKAMPNVNNHNRSKMD